MNKIYRITILMILVSLCLIACDPVSYYYKYDTLIEEIIAIELISYDGSDIKIVKDKESVRAFDFEKMNIIESLEENQISSFLLSFSKIQFFPTSEYSNSPIGLGIRLISTTGNFNVAFCTIINDIAYSFVGTYSSNGSMVEVIGDFARRSEFVKMIDTYF